MQEESDRRITKTHGNKNLTRMAGSSSYLAPDTYHSMSTADDELIFRGGTILNLIKEGWEVSWILCTKILLRGNF